MTLGGDTVAGRLVLSREAIVRTHRRALTLLA
jgi:hypothetical protein